MTFEDMDSEAQVDRALLEVKIPDPAATNSTR